MGGGPLEMMTTTTVTTTSVCFVGVALAWSAENKNFALATRTLRKTGYFGPSGLVRLWPGTPRGIARKGKELLIAC